jgi:RNA polymerase sigma-70 factor (ECF subfamily)
MKEAHDGAATDCGIALLVRRAREGDMVAFRSLYDAHVGRVHALSLRLSTERADAEELTQDVFVAAWRQLAAYRGTALFSTWLHGITVRLSRQRLRGLLRRRAREEKYMLDYTAALTATMAAPDIALERALAQLPQRMRTALVLHAVEGHTQAQTAELMGITEGAVKAHIHRARALLHERLDVNG